MHEDTKLLIAITKDVMKKLKYKAKLDRRTATGDEYLNWVVRLGLEPNSHTHMKPLIVKFIFYKDKTIYLEMLLAHDWLRKSFAL